MDFRFNDVIVKLGDIYEVKTNKKDYLMGGKDFVGRFVDLLVYCSVEPRRKRVERSELANREKCKALVER